VFHEGFVAGDVGTPLLSFDEGTAATAAAAVLDRHGVGVAGVRRDGLVTAWVERTRLTGGTCGEHAVTFHGAAVMDATASLGEVVRVLRTEPRVFLRSLGFVAATVTRADVQKPPARMWLFGMVTLIEMRITRMIEDRFPGGAWSSLLSEGRRAKAEELRAERVRRGENPTLTDCLQLSDKGQIVARCEDLRGRTPFRSRGEAERAVKALEQLRNSLAHAQTIATDDWEDIARLAERLDGVLLDPPGQAAPDSARPAG
jgi:hypothetical protein